jgi:hypothetical protein
MAKEIITEPKIPNKPIIPDPKRKPIPDKPRQTPIPDTKPNPGRKVI